jgi:DNA-binding NtrC family response regulator
LAGPLSDFAGCARTSYRTDSRDDDMEPAHVVDGTMTGRPDREPWPATRPRLAEAAFPSGAEHAAERRLPIRAVRDADALVHRVARSRVSVLITGETGVGKEVLARRLHDLSPRASRSFVALNCAAISDSLLESELFGHQRGAFTGAETGKPGLIEAADGGTFFLDEVSELSLGAQAKLLRVIETRAVHRLGALSPREVDVRFVAATNRAIDTDVGEGRFRADLLFRLDGIRLHLPPLRDRVAEILPAAEQFLAELAARDGVCPPALSEAARRALRGHVWSGNFRELRNVIERAALLCEGDRIEPRDLLLRDLLLVERSVAVGLPVSAPNPHPPAPGGDTAARERILAALKACAGNQTRAARMLGVSRRTLINWLEAHGLPRPRKRALKVLPGAASAAT